MELIRFNREMARTEEFYKLYKFLFQEPFKKLTNNARIAYTLLKDRMALSIKNSDDFTDKDGNIYVIYKRADLVKILGISEKTVYRVLQELKKHGLLEEESQYNNLPKRLYLLTPSQTIDPNPDYNRNRKYDRSGTVNMTGPYNKNKTNNNKTNNNINNKLSCLVIDKYNKGKENDKDKDKREKIKNKTKKDPHTKKTCTSHLHPKYIIPENEVLKQLIHDYQLPNDSTTKAYISRVLEIYYSSIDEAIKMQNNPQILDPSHIAYVINGINRRAREIKNFNRYVKTSLENSKRDLQIYLQNLTRQSKLEHKEKHDDEEKIIEMWDKKR